MKTIPVIYFLILFLILPACSEENGRMNSRSVSIASLKKGFKDPPREAGVRCWWWWLNSNVTKDCITKDLEAMHDKGFSGAMIFDAGTEPSWGPDGPVPNGPMFSGPEWTELFLHALNEAKRLDLKLGLSIQSGWNLGGPTITLDEAAKQICWSETTINGPVKDKELALPQHNHDYYRDICVLAFPERGSRDRLPISHLSAKTGARELGGSAPDCRFLLNDNPSVEGEEDTSLDEIIDISDRMNAGGLLNWDPPPGNWTIMRFGYTPTLAHVKTSSDNWKGHVLDYLDKEVFNKYWNDIVDPLLKSAGSMAGTVLTHLETDSWECGGMNWSTGFPDYFESYCGYDIIKYLPVVAGKIIDSRELSNCFLADLRKTIAACVSENHYATFAERAAEYNMGIQPESAGPHAAPIDGITNYSHSDIVMSEFWVPSPHRPNPENRFFAKQASSAAHIYGKQLVGAEAFTSIRKPTWSDVLWRDQKPSMDHEFCSGLNMIFFHTFTASPDEMGEPGQEYFAGTHVNRHVSWWDYSDAFMDYIKRVQFVVQKGTFVADVLYYYGDHVPNIARLKEDDPAGVLPGFDYDVTNEEVLLQLSVIDGNIVVPSGLQYRILSLPDHKVLSYAALKKIDLLLQAGATVMGPKPDRLVSLAGGEAARKEFHELADKLWGNSGSETGILKVGEGTLVWGPSAHQYLRSKGVAQDFELVRFQKSPNIDYIHYTIDGADVYFVSNQSGEAQSIDAVFRVSGKKAEIWDPVTGEITSVRAFKQVNNRTRIPLSFDPYGSCFVVFNKSMPTEEQGKEKLNFPELSVEKEIKGSWQVTFDPKWGYPGSVEFEELYDWTQSSDDAIKYYSGSAVYDKVFDFPKVERYKNYWLKLSNVGDVGIAAIELNGKDLGIVWTSPFRIKLEKALKSGENNLKITVVNNWHNRLIGERDKPESEKLLHTNVRVRHDWILQESGLLGPVEILSARSK